MLIAVAPEPMSQCHPIRRIKARWWTAHKAGHLIENRSTCDTQLPLDVIRTALERSARILQAHLFFQADYISDATRESATSGVTIGYASSLTSQEYRRPSSRLCARQEESPGSYVHGVSQRERRGTA